MLGLGLLIPELNNRSGGLVPAWVLPGATIDLDFANGLYYGGTLASLLSITRASNATDLLPSSASGYAYNTFGSNVLSISPTFGLLVFEARTNVLLNSTVPATQTTASLGTGSYTLWVNGSGSALASGGTATITGAASASNGSPNAFTVTVAGTITVTVTGSLNAFQLEAGAFGTSFIVTAGATATRAADAVTVMGALATALRGATGTVLVSVSNVGNTNQATNDAVFIGATAVNNQLLGNFNATNNKLQAYDGTTVTAVLLGSGTFASARLGAAWSGTTISISGNGGSVGAGNYTATHAQTWLLGSVGTFGQYVDGDIKRVTVFPNRVVDAALPGLTQ